MPDFSFELAAGAPRVLVAGVDEVGRGPLAGAVVAAAVIFPTHFMTEPTTHHWLSAINDSKKLSAAKRVELAALITQHCMVGIGRASVAEIDELNILQASLLAMTRAVAALSVQPAQCLIDGNRVPKNLPVPASCIVGGDAKSLSIAAASIIAKQARDAEMQNLHANYPAYGWAENAGYPTPAHLKALAQHGATPHHRTSFAPVRAVLKI